jgi:nucleotide-binding universal stress UspA family protein
MAGFKRVLCPVDLSELSIRALACAAHLAARDSSELIILHVVPTFEPMEVRAGELFDPVTFVYPMTPEQIEARLREAGRAAGFTLERARVVARAGEPAEAIVNEALATKADLVVIGAHGRSGLAAWGSTTEHVVRAAPCSVLTFRAPGEHAR